MNIGVIGLGYVGLPLAMQFARSSATVVGLDVDESRVRQINQNQSYIKHIEAKTNEPANSVGSAAYGMQRRLPFMVQLPEVECLLMSGLDA